MCELFTFSGPSTVQEIKTLQVSEMKGNKSPAIEPPPGKCPYERCLVHTGLCEVTSWRIFFLLFNAPASSDS